MSEDDPMRTTAEVFTPVMTRRWYDERGEVSPERAVLKEILAALLRIEALLQKPDGK